MRAPLIMSHAPVINLGDTGFLDAKPVGNTGAVEITIREGNAPRASVIVQVAGVHGLIRALCNFSGVRVHDNQSLKG